MAVIASLTDVVVKHPGAVLIAFAVLAVLYILMLLWHFHSSSSFANNNLTTGSNNPQWYAGGADAGTGGSMARGPKTTSSAAPCGAWGANAMAEASALGNVGAYGSLDDASLTRLIHSGTLDPSASMKTLTFDPDAAAAAVTK
jgi:hypothetical protein